MKKNQQTDGPIVIRLGATCPPLSSQMKDLLPAADLKRLDILNDAVSTCVIAGLAGDAEKVRMRKRLLKLIGIEIAAHRSANPPKVIDE